MHYWALKCCPGFDLAGSDQAKQQKLSNKVIVGKHVLPVLVLSESFTVMHSDRATLEHCHCCYIPGLAFNLLLLVSQARLQQCHLMTLAKAQ